MRNNCGRRLATLAPPQPHSLRSCHRHRWFVSRPKTPKRSQRKASQAVRRRVGEPGCGWSYGWMSVMHTPQSNRERRRCTREISSNQLTTIAATTTTSSSPPPPPPPTESLHHRSAVGMKPTTLCCVLDRTDDLMTNGTRKVHACMQPIHPSIHPSLACSATPRRLVG